jgi:hypothetical protein
LAIVLLAVVGGTSAASAQQSPTVRLAGTTPMSVSGQCFTEPTTSPGSFTLERRSTTGPLTVTYHIDGGPTDLNSEEVAGADHTVEFADGEATVTVVVHPATNASAATVTVLEGETYNVAQPSSGTIEVQRSVVTCATDTTLGTDNTLARTGVRSTSGTLALVGITAVALGSLLLVLSSRRKATGLR